MGTRQTSIDCYNQIKNQGLLTKRRFEIYEAIFKNAPCTTNEALKDVYSASHGVGSRTTELREQGVIYEKGEKKCSITGRNVIEWDLTDRLPIDLPKKKNTTHKIKDLKEMINELNNKTSDLYVKSELSMIYDYIEENF